MNHEIARVALEFMKRVQLNGEEVQAYQAVVASLSRMAQPEPPEPQPEPAPEADQEATTH